MMTPDNESLVVQATPLDKMDAVTTPITTIPPSRERDEKEKTLEWCLSTLPIGMMDDFIE
jgi:hypothetical protein